MKTGLKKWQKRSLITAGVIVGIVLLLALFINQYWSPILAKKLKSAVLTGSDSLYRVDFSDAELHVLKGEIDIFNITLKPDTAVFNRLKRNGIGPNNLVELHVKKLSLLHIHPFNLYFNHKLDIGQVILKRPEVKVSYSLNHTRDTTVKDNRTTWQKMSKTLNSIHIGQILLSDIQLKYDDYSGNKLVISELKEMNISATDLLIDSTTQTDKSRSLYCRDVDADLNNYTGKTPDGLYTYKIKTLQLSTQASRLIMEGLDLRPIQTSEFFRKSDNDRFDIHLDTLEADHFDYVRFHKYRIINASRLMLTGGALNLFSNPHGKKPVSDRVRTYPHFGLKDLKADLDIDTIEGSRVSVSYTEFNQKSGKAGTITFNNTSGRFLNVTNNKAALQKNNLCTADLTSYFMNRSRMEVAVTFNLTDPSLPFSYKGTAGPMDLHVLNPAVMPLGLFKINTGKLQRFEFDINADDKASKGRVSLLYDSLKVTVLKADTGHDRLRHMTIASLYANNLILKRSNPDAPGETPRSFFVTFNRPANFPFFKTIWHTLRSGIKSSIGFDEKMQQSVKDKMAELSLKKEQRKIKKAERIQRREERRRKRELKKELKAQQQAIDPSLSPNH